MGFADSVFLGYENWRNFSGRACRSEFWHFALFSFVIGLFVFIFGGLIEDWRYLILACLYAVFVGIPGFSLAVRRLHDLNSTGWAIIIFWIPIIGSLIMLISMCWRGTDGDNKYGPPRVPSKKRDMNIAPEPPGSWIEEND